MTDPSQSEFINSGAWLNEPYKRSFAYNWCIYPTDPYQAALATVGADHAHYAVVMAKILANDEATQRYRDDYMREHGGAAGFVPDKEQIALELLTVARGASNADTKHKFYKLFGEFMGYVSKPAETGAASKAESRGVMLVPTTMTPQQWESNAVEAQGKLLTDVRT